MPKEIRGTEYFTHREVLERIGVERSTLWRWRTGGKVPMGRSSNRRQVYFTAQEVEAIEEYAFGLNPIGASGPTQLRLFDNQEVSR